MTTPEPTCMCGDVAHLMQVQTLLNRLADGERVELGAFGDAVHHEEADCLAAILREVADEGLHKLYAM